jgi:hypothetical protein
MGIGADIYNVDGADMFKWRICAMGRHTIVQIFAWVGYTIGQMCL